jgi:hypothetical protein
MSGLEGWVKYTDESWLRESYRGESVMCPVIFFRFFLMLVRCPYLASVHLLLLLRHIHKHPNSQGTA